MKRSTAFERRGTAEHSEVAPLFRCSLPRGAAEPLLRYSSSLLVVSLLLIAGVGCNRAARENQADPGELVARLSSANSADQRIAVLDALSNVDASTVSNGRAGIAGTVRQLLGDPNALVRAKAGEVLAYWGDRSVTPALVHLLGDPDPVIRFSGAASLTALGDPAASSELVRLTGDADSTVRAQACNALAALGVQNGSAAPEALLARLRDPDAAVRAAAVEALGRLRQRDALPAIRQLLSDPQPGVIAAAARTVGALDDGTSLT
jgi:HEAT repeat protein